MFPRLRRRGAIAVTQGRVGLSTRTDHLLTKAADRASAQYVIHNQAPHLTATPDKCGCGDALLCLPLLAMLLTQTEAQSGFTTWFPWLLARRKPSGHRLRASHTSNDVLGLRQPSISERSKSHLANDLCRNRRHRRNVTATARIFSVVGLPVRIAVELINGATDY